MPLGKPELMTSTPARTTSLQLVQRAPQRISITIPYAMYHALIERSDYEGRSISNLAAFLLEKGLNP
jgi:hypothetical protein